MTQPEWVLVAGGTETARGLGPPQLAEQNGNVNCWLLEIHLCDTDNKENIRGAETVSDLL